MPKTQFKPLTFSIPPELLDPIRRRCQHRDTDRSKYLRDLIRRDLQAAGLLPARQKQAA